jgi:arylsulfatase A-like enzyme
MNGLIALMGEGIRENEIITGAQIIDVAPTILHLLGLSVPVDMDGRVLEQALQENSLASHPVRYAAAPEGRGGQAGTYSQQESALIEERLKELGYWG